MKWLKALRAAAAVVAVMLVIWLVVGNDVANRREIEVMRAWAEAPGALTAFLARFPAEETNEAARRLEAAAAALDIDLKPRSQAPAGPATAASKRASQDNQTLREYLNAELSTPAGSAGPPSPVAVAVFDRTAPHLGAVKEILATGEPRWRTEIARGFDAPIPNLLGQLQLQRVLLASAFREASRKNATEAEALLEASWALNAPLRARPEFISKLIGMAVGRLEAGVLRKVPVPPEPWIQRLSGYDPRQGMIDAFQSDAWAFHESLLRTALGSGTNGSGRPSCLSRIVLGPVIRIQFAQIHENWREIILSALRSPVSDGDGHADFPHVKEPRSVADILIAMSLPNTVSAWKRADRLTVELELTRKVLEIRAARGTSKKWPRMVDGIEASALKDARWIYAVTPEAHASIELSRRLDWGETTGLVLPTRWISAD